MAFHHGPTDQSLMSWENPRASGPPGATRPQTDEFPSLVDQLCSPCNGDESSVLRGPGHGPLPSRDVLSTAVEDLRSVLFPGYFGTSELSKGSMRFHIGSTLDRLLGVLQEQIWRGLCFDCTEVTVTSCAICQHRSLDCTRSFFNKLPEIQQKLSRDVLAAFQGDPAAPSPDEVVFSYPGLLAITNYRIAHELFLLHVPVIPRIITELAHGATGIDIHPGARIGEGLFIDHGTGVVIGETCEIGDRVRIYQGVTLGAKSFPMDKNGNAMKGTKRHPIVQDDAIIYSGATILGRVTIGRGSTIGGNVWLDHDVAPGSVITQARVRSELFQNGGGI